MDTLEPFTVTAIALQNIYALNTVTAKADKIVYNFLRKKLLQRTENP